MAYSIIYLRRNGIFLSMIGKALKYMRKTQNLKQDVLAKQLGISQQNLSRYENEQRIISFETIEQIANTCDYEIYFIQRKTKEKFKVEDLKRKDV